MTAVFICRMKRTAIGRYGGGLSMVRPDDMAALVIDAVLGDEELPVDEVVLGCANQAGEDNRNVARMAVLLSKLPGSVPALTVNRLCASGLDAVIHAARGIALGDHHIAIAGGVESMSRAPFVMPKAEAAFTRKAELHDSTIGWRFVNDRIAAQHGIESMPETAENVAAEKAISRSDQDAYALRSQQRYDATWHAADIVGISVAGAKGQTQLFNADEAPRVTSLDKLAGLPTPFRTGGSVTAGNASGVNDGAAVLLLASEKAIKQFNLLPLARIVSSTSAGVAPRLMGLGPVAALEKLQQRTGLSARDFDVLEVNEAFAAQVLGCTRAWGIADDAAQLNAKGGAIAMGHPLGMTGARIAGTAARRLHEGGGNHALATLCVGVGQGVALALKRP